MPKDRPEAIAREILDFPDQDAVCVRTFPSKQLHWVDAETYKDWLDPDPSEDEPPEFSEPGGTQLYSWAYGNERANSELEIQFTHDEGDYQNRQDVFVEMILPTCEHLKRWISAERLFDQRYFGKSFNPKHKQKLHDALRKGLIRTNNGNIAWEKGVTGGPVPVTLVDYDDESEDGYRRSRFMFHDVLDFVCGLPAMTVRVSSDGMLERLNGACASCQGNVAMVQTIYDNDGEELAWALEQFGVKGISPKFRVGDVLYSQAFAGDDSEIFKKTAAAGGWQLPQQQKQERVRRPSQGFIHLLEMRRREKWGR